MPFMNAQSISVEGLLALALIGLVMAVRQYRRKGALRTKGVDLRESERHFGVITIAPGTKFSESRLGRAADLRNSFTN